MCSWRFPIRNYMYLQIHPTGLGMTLWQFLVSIFPYQYHLKNIALRYRSLNFRQLTLTCTLRGKLQTMSMQNFWVVKEVHFGIVQVVNGLISLWCHWTTKFLFTHAQEQTLLNPRQSDLRFFLDPRETRVLINN